MEKINVNSIFLNLCVEVLKHLEDSESREAYVKKLLEPEIQSKMSEQDYIHYQFLKVLNQMYKVGFEEGKKWVGDAIGQDENHLNIGTYLNRKISQRKSISESFILKVGPIIKGIREEGAETFRDVARKLTERGVKTVSGHYMWHPATVRDVEAKIASRVTELINLKESINGEINLLK
jgi:hypothetical protein